MITAGIIVAVSLVLVVAGNMRRARAARHESHGENETIDA
jgi:hypothetical protein